MSEINFRGKYGSAGSKEAYLARIRLGLGKKLSGEELSDMKSLGRAIGSVVNPSEFDGDGDGFMVGPDGVDNVPVVSVPKLSVSRHSGAKFLDDFGKQRSALEKRFGDLSKVENAEAAFRATFPNLKTFSLFDDGEKSLPASKVAYTVSLLHLGQDERVAKTITSLSLFGDEIRSGTGQCHLGFIFEDGELPKFNHGIRFRGDVNDAPDFTGFEKIADSKGGWPDVVVQKMRKEGASQTDMDTFWFAALANHEWSHAEHNAATFEYLGLSFDDDALDVLKKVFVAGGADPKKVDDDFKKGLDAIRASDKGQTDAQVRSAFALKQFQVHNPQFKEFLRTGGKDDLTEAEERNLGTSFAKMVSGYAGVSFQEFVAEKNSAVRMGFPAGPSNPAWRKLAAFISGGVEAELETVGLTRQQRRELERRAGKKSLEEDLKKKNPGMNEIVLMQTCEGLTYLDDLKKNGKKSLFSNLTGISIVESLDEQIPDAVSEAVTPSQDDNDWVSYSYAGEGSEGVLGLSEEFEFFDWENDFSEEELSLEVDGKSLKDWFREDWVDISRPKPDGGFEPCGRDDANKGKYPKCVPASRAAKMSAEEIASAVRRKRRAESVEVRQDKKPIYVSTDKKDESSIDISEKAAIPTNSALYARVKAEAKAKFDVYPSAYANAWLVREYKKRGGKYRTGEKELADDISEKGEVLRDPKGGLTAAGRRHFRETEGSNLLPGVRGRADTPKKMRRKGSFLTRFFTNPSGPMKDEKGRPTRLALSAAAWGEPVPQNMEDAAKLAAKGRRLLERYAKTKEKDSYEEENIQLKNLPPFRFIQIGTDEDTQI